MADIIIIISPWPLRSYAEVAAALDMTVKQVKNTEQRAFRKMREWAAEHPEVREALSVTVAVFPVRTGWKEPSEQEQVSALGESWNLREAGNESKEEQVSC